MQKSRMETALQAGINGLASSNFSDQLGSPYNEPHPGGIQRKTQGKGNLGFWIAKLGARPKGGESGGPILVIRICFGFRYSDFGFAKVMGWALSADKNEEERWARRSRR